MNCFISLRRRHLDKAGTLLFCNQWRTHKFFTGFIQWYVVVICIWCALFVMSQFDVIFMFPNQRFGQLC